MEARPTADRLGRRDAVLAQMEAHALEVEQSTADLSAREDRFVELVVRTNNGVTAARDAGYRNPDSAAVKLLGTQKILDAIEARRTAEAIRVQAAAKKMSSRA